MPTEFFADASNELREEMAAVVSAFHPVGFRLMADALAEGDTTDLLPEIAVPALLPWGQEDRRSPVDVAERFRGTIRGAELVLVPKAGHVSNMERPQEIDAHVRRFCLAHA